MLEVRIYFRDLTEEKQKEVLEAYGIESEKDGNFDLFPLTILYVEEEEEE